MTCVLLAARDPQLTQRWAAELLAVRAFKPLPSVQSSAQARHLLNQHRPALLITELQLLDGFSGDLIRSLQYHAPDRRVLTLVLHHADQNQLVLEALQAGANSFLSLDTSAPGSVAEAALNTLSGGASIAPWVAQRMLEHFGVALPHRPSAIEELSSPLALSADERALLRSLSGGQPMTELAAELGLTAQAVVGRLRTIYRKMQWMLRAGDLKLS